MSIDDLDQALLEAKWGNAERDEYEVIERLLDLPREVVLRVAFCVHAVYDTRMPCTPDTRHDSCEIPEEVRTAITELLRLGILRVQIRKAILGDSHMFTTPAKLKVQAAEMCRGCPISIDCTVQGLSTPPQCYAAGPLVLPLNGTTVGSRRFPFAGVKVFPNKIRKNKVTVQCLHPTGEYIVNVWDLWL